MTLNQHFSGCIDMQIVVRTITLILASGVFPGALTDSHAADNYGVPNVVALYTKNCAICHGDKGDGNTRAQSGLRPPPRNFTTVEAALELTRVRMILSVTEGRPGTGMMAHKGRLSTTEIAALVDYIRANFMRTPEVEVKKSAGGKKIYEKNCAVCHGDKGNTAVWAQSGLNPPPRDFTTVEAQRLLTRKRMIKSVTNGRPGTGMVSFANKFSAVEIAQVVDYIRDNLMAGPGAAGANPGEMRPDTIVRGNAHAGTAGKPSGMIAPHTQSGLARGVTSSAQPGQMPGGHAINVDMNEPMPNNLTGDKDWGRSFFMKNCYTCHGIKGEGNGPRAHFNIPRPRNFTSENSRQILNRVRLFNSITNGRVGTVMPAWRQVLSQQEIANLAEFVFSAFIQIDPKKNEDVTKGRKKKAH